MKEFYLTYEVFYLEDVKNVRFFPADESISGYICTWMSFSVDALESEMDSFSEQMRPMLFSDFKSMENVPSYIRDSYYLNNVL
jgi:hypothetical protein